ncbi:hypothetical protein EVAR_73736_1 [Eumeta japonica]|uniref:Uncharacterized protein n=1 Tax=Eumeta variegata TaxID=151549 RepID=A0A4C1T6T6_EUMVA|nr:hypothetical protein EVAR_73736_1 [Eumeta japonica]
MEIYEVVELPIANLFNEILVVLENILSKLVEEASREDMSTLEDISALKSNAETLPTDSARASMIKETEEAASAGPLKSFEDKGFKLKNCWGN